MGTQTLLPEWKESKSPYFNEAIDSEMLGPDLRIKRFMIFEDEALKVQRVEEPLYNNEFNNYIEVLIKNGFILMHFPIGGCINRKSAIENARDIVTAFLNQPS